MTWHVYIWHCLGDSEDSDVCCHLESKVEVKEFERMTNVEKQDDTLFQRKYKLYFLWISDQR